MRLLFPNGEHAPIELDEGTQIVGSAVGSEVLLTAPGVALKHCELKTRKGHSVVVPLDTTAPTILNGKQIDAEVELKPGDLLLFSRVGCRVVASTVAPLVTTRPPIAVAPPPENERTRVRMALPKYVLRGVSGPTFGKVYGVAGTFSLGRSHDCDVCIPIDEISRHHAQIKIQTDGVVVEDMGSANGTFVNDHRVQSPTALKPGDELRLDTVRFLFMSPGLETPAAATISETGDDTRAGSSAAAWVIFGVLILIAAAIGALAYLGRL